MRFAVPKETSDRESRVALVPEAAKSLIQKGHHVSIQSKAGMTAFIQDTEYQAVGCEIMADAHALFNDNHCILKVNAPTESELEMIPEGKALVCLLWASRNTALISALQTRKITSFSMDAIPRISRAQNMDVLSSMATIAGYKAVLMAATHLGKFLPMLTTAAGTIRPAQGLIIGAGVAGLQAIATARRLGAMVEAFDTRPAVKEQVQSLGANFVEIGTVASAQDASGYAKEISAEHLVTEKNILAERVRLADFIITTALIPGKPAPKLITKEMVQKMKPGSVIIDLAAEAGGNCELTYPNKIIYENDITILGPTNLAATLPLDASRMYARNMAAFLNHIVRDGDFSWDWKDEIFTTTCTTHPGQIPEKRVAP